MPKDQDFTIENVESKTVFKGKIWDIVSETFEFAGESLTREFVDHPGAVAIVATNDVGQILMIRQYRHPVRSLLWEIPAGLTDIPGEVPIAAAHRELEEETGYRAGQLSPLIEFYTTPGGNNELIRIFHAVDLQFVGRPAAEGEERELKVEWVDFGHALKAVLSSEIKSPSAVIGIMALALGNTHLDR